MDLKTCQIVTGFKYLKFDVYYCLKRAIKLLVINLEKQAINSERPYLPISAVAEIMYCPRNFYYRVVEGAEESNCHLLEGRLQEEKRNERPSISREKYHQDRSVHVFSDRLGINGVIDVVEQGDEIYPVEYKKGLLKENLNDDVQVCAQAMALEEILDRQINQGYIYYVQSNARREVLFDESLRLMVENTVTSGWDIIKSGEVPPPLSDKRCVGCALMNRCLPFEISRITGSKSTVTRPQPGINLGRVLYVDDQGASLNKKGERILVTRDDVKLKDIPLCNLDQVVLVGTVQISSQLIKLFLERGTEVHFISMHGRYYGCLQPSLSKNSVLRISQHKQFQNEGIRLPYAREFVKGKLSNMRIVILRHNRLLNLANLSAAASKIKAIINKIDGAESINSLMGLEGIGSREYFNVFGNLIKEKLPYNFHGRSRRPPGDPVNALLSFSYSLLLKDVVTSIQVVGFDPYIGFLHRSDFGRPALALDIMEEFRPVMADGVVLTLINKGMVTQSDFEYRFGGCFLNESGRKKLYRVYEERRREVVTHPVFGYRLPLLRIIELQVRFLAKVLMGELEKYKAYLTR